MTDVLEAGVLRPLTVVSAPAGYGKTTALVEWLGASGRDFAWLSVDERDNDPLRLCADLLAALDRARPGCLHEAQRALAGRSDLLDAVVPLAVAGLGDRAGDELVLVVDDYHLVTDDACHQLLTALIDGAPPGLRAVIAGRTQPPLRLARRRSQGKLVELGAEQLRFRDDEAERLLNGSLELDLGPDEIEAIEARVHGWAAGLSLVASSLRARDDREGFLAAFTASRGEVSQYLIEEVLDATGERLRDFLTRTSILTRLSAPLCEAVLDDSSARGLLAEVERSNLFVTVLHGEDGDWVVYHDLFRELLERDLHDRSPELVPLLHRRAADWFAANGMPAAAIRHAIGAGEGELAAGLLHDNWRQLLLQRRYVEIRRAIAQLPPERGELSGFCEALDVLCMALEGTDLRLVAERLDALEPRREEPGVAEIVDQLRVSPYYGDVQRAVEVGWELWRRYGLDIRKRAFIAGQFGVVLWFAGRGGDARDVLEPIMREIDRSTGRAWALSALSLSYADDGEQQLAEAAAREALELVEHGGAEEALEAHITYIALGEALRLRGALDEAEVQFAHAERLTGKLPGSLYHACALVFQARQAFAARDRRRARSLAGAARRIVDRYPDVGALADRLAAVEGALARRADDALLGSRPTPAELRLLELLPTNLTLRQIASEHLYVSIHTVTSHARRLYRRLGVKTRMEAVQAARERGLI